MRDPPLHEKAAFLALGLLAGGSSSFVKAQLADLSTDRGRGTDLFLLKRTRRGRTRMLPIDLTEAHQRVINRKFQRNRELKREGRGRSIWILRVGRELVIEIGADPCFPQAWERLKTYEPVAFSPQDICPEHGEECSLMGKLSLLGRDLIFCLRRDFQALFE